VQHFCIRHLAADTEDSAESIVLPFGTLRRMLGQKQCLVDVLETSSYYVYADHNHLRDLTNQWLHRASSERKRRSLCRTLDETGTRA
jgi:hypothetical protein